MKVYNSIFEYQKKNKSILTLGTFDGVHIGHKKIIKKLTKQTLEYKYESVLLTFFPHPRMVLKQDVKIQLLNTIEEKIKLIKATGIQHLIIHPFDAIFSELTAEDFVKKVLVDQLNIGKIIIGHDHKFGKNRAANIDDLIELGEKYNFEVDQISVKEIDSISISSTKIRTALLAGKIELANAYLGHPYAISGVVVEGKKIGRTIGFPTANIELTEDYKLIPKNGVYVVSCEMKTGTVFGMMNIGNNPTVEGKKNSIEIHFFDFNKTIYQEQISVYLHARIRDEQKFNSLEALKNQLVLDKKYSIDYVQKNTATIK